MRAPGPTAILSLALAGSLCASPALAHDRHHDEAGGAWPGAPLGYGYPPPMQAAFRVDPRLAERCGLRAGMSRPHRYDADYYDADYHGERDDGLGGTLIGGAVGGVVGNRVAGHGDRALGTVAGAAVGALAGAAIDRAEDGPGSGADWAEPGEPLGDACDGALPAGYTLISVPGERECHDVVTTTEEWVPETVTVPGRTPIRRAPPLRDKRTKLRRIK